MSLVESIVELPAGCTLSFHPGCIFDSLSGEYICGPIGATGCRGCQGPAPPRDPEEERRREEEERRRVEEERRRVEEYKRRYKGGVVVTVTTPTGPLYDSFRKLTLDYQNEHPEERLQIIAREPRTESTRSPKPECLVDIDQRNQLRAKRDNSIKRLIAELEELGYQNDELDYGWTKYPEEETIPSTWYDTVTTVNYQHAGFDIRCHCESNLCKTLTEKGLYDEKRVTDKILGRC